MRKGHIFFVSGVSGAGKTSVVGMIKKLQLPGFECVLSCKTRLPRQGEVSGVDYHYFTFEDFQKGIQGDIFLEYNFIHNQDYYGTLTADVIENGIEKGKYIVKEIDVGSIQKIRENYPALQPSMSFIFLDIPTASIKERMLLRGDDISGDDYKNRIESSLQEHKMVHLCDYIIDSNNKHLDILFTEVMELINEIIQKRSL